MRIIQLLPELNAGGVEKGTLELARELTAQGHDSLVVSAGGSMVEQLIQEGSRHLALPIHRKRLRSLGQIPALRKLFLREKPDVIHLRSRLPAWLAWLAWRQLKASERPRLVTTVHGFYSVNPYSRIMTRGEKVICVSAAIKDYVRANYPKTPEENLRVVHRGIEPDRYPYGFRPSPEWLERWRSEFPQLVGKSIVTLPGRITRLKGHLDFLELIAGVKKEGLPVHGLLIGQSSSAKASYRQEIDSTIAAAGLRDDITWIPHRKDLREIMALSSAVVSCSIQPEAFSRVTLEALALGRPVLGYDHGGVRELLNQLLPEGKIPVGDTTAMIRKLSDWLTSPPSPRKDSPFTLKAMLAGIMRVYEEARDPA